MGLEIERKYTLTDAVMEAVGQAFGPWQTIRMETTYYDAADGRLSRQKMTLRRRMENDVSICTLKVPALGGARGEWEMQAQSIHQALPFLIQSSGVDSFKNLTAEDLCPLCAATFTRLACTCSLPDCAVEIAMDKGVLTAGGNQMPLQELEVELKSGSEAAMFAFCAQLEKTYGLQEEPRSKFQRARALGKGCV